MLKIYILKLSEIDAPCWEKRIDNFRIKTYKNTQFMQKIGCFVLKVLLNTLFQISSLGAPQLNWRGMLMLLRFMYLIRDDIASLR